MWMIAEMIYNAPANIMPGIYSFCKILQKEEEEEEEEED